MTTLELLAQLEKLDVRLWAEGDQLRCDAPKGVLTPELQRLLRAAKPELLAHLRHDKNGASSNRNGADGEHPLLLSKPAVVTSPSGETHPQSDGVAAPVNAWAPIPRHQPLSLSAGQQRLWAVKALVSDPALHNITEAIRLRGPLDPRLLEQSVSQLVARQESLRTAIVQSPSGSPVQQVAPPRPYLLSLHSLVGANELSIETGPKQEIVGWTNSILGDDDKCVAVTDEKLQSIINREARHAFDWSQAPLFRMLLAQVGVDDHLLILTMHHLIADALSLAIFWRELGILYTALAAGRPAPLPALPLQYVDYAHYQQQWLQSEAAQKQQRYWQQQLTGSIPLQLPVGRVRTIAPSYHAGRQTLALPASLAEALKATARREKVTLFVFLLAAFKTLLYRYTGQEDLIVCAPTAGRNRTELEEVIGYFNNILALRTDLSGNPNFCELLQRVRQTVMMAHDQQELPFYQVAALPNVLPIPLTRALFEFREAVVHPLALSGVAVSVLPVEKGSADFDLFLIVYKRDDALTCVVHYKTGLFEDDAIACFLANFQTILEYVVFTPTQALRLLPSFSSPMDLSQTTGTAPLNGNGKHSTSAPLTQVKPIVQPTIVANGAFVVQLTKIWEQAFNRRPIGAHDNFFELGGHSLLAAYLLAQIEQQLVGERLPLALVLQAPTIAQMAALLQSQGWRSSWASLTPLQLQGAHPPFYFVHGHDGNVVGYYALAEALGERQPFYALQALGMDNPQAVPYHLAAMAAHYIQEIRTVQPHGPYYLGGFCMGAFIAYEMAQQLTALGETVGLLAMVHSPHPDYPRYLPGVTPLRRKLHRWLWRLGLELYNFDEVEINAKATYTLARSQRLFTTLLVKLEQKFDAGFKRLGLSHSQAYLMEEVGNAHNKAYSNYAVQPYAGRVALIYAEKQPLGIYADPMVGWSETLQGAVEIHKIPGYRIGMLDKPRVHSVAMAINRSLADAQT